MALRITPTSDLPAPARTGDRLRPITAPCKACWWTRSATAIAICADRLYHGFSRTSSSLALIQRGCAAADGSVRLRRNPWMASWCVP